jgi:hypothetical protein
MAIEQFANKARTLLDGSINDSTTSIDVVDFATFPPDSQFRILIDNEIMIVTAGAGTTTWTVTRGAEDTIARAHADGAVVRNVLTKGALEQFQKDGATYGPIGNLPADADGRAGMTWYPSNSCLMPVHDGSEWRYFGPVFGPLNPPLTTFTTWVNQGTRGVVSTTSNFIHFSDAGPVSGGEFVMARVDTAPATPWTLTGLMLYNSVNTFGAAGLVLRDSGTGRLKAWASLCTDNKLYVYNWSSPTVFNNNPFSLSLHSKNPLMLRITNDGTTLSFQASVDFVNWTTCYTELVAGNFIANVDQAGYMLNNLTGSYDRGSTSVLHCEFT